MKRRILTAFILCAAAAASVGACESGHDYYYGYPYPYTCGEYSSCGSCTPVAGCGWCAFEGGGVCLHEPSECGVSTFVWSWKPEDCPGAAAGQSDAAATPPSRDGGATAPADATTDR